MPLASPLVPIFSLGLVHSGPVRRFGWWPRPICFCFRRCSRLVLRCSACRLSCRLRACITSCCFCCPDFSCLGHPICRRCSRGHQLHTHTHPPKRLAHPRSPIPPLSTLTSRATHAHPTGLYYFEFEFPGLSHCLHLCCSCFRLRCHRRCCSSASRRHRCRHHASHRRRRCCCPARTSCQDCVPPAHRRPCLPA